MPHIDNSLQIYEIQGDPYLEDNLSLVCVSPGPRRVQYQLGVCLQPEVDVRFGTDGFVGLFVHDRLMSFYSYERPTWTALTQDDVLVLLEILSNNNIAPQVLTRQ